MKLKILFLITITSFLLINTCVTPEQGAQQAQTPEEIQQMIKELGLESDRSADEERSEIRRENSGLLLSDYLKRVSGVNIITVGGETSVRIRGVTSIEGNNVPLFVINGAQIGHSYAAAEQSVAVEDIDYISVLRGNDASQRYGSRGTAGVIEIFTKK